MRPAALPRGAQIFNSTYSSRPAHAALLFRSLDCSSTVLSRLRRFLLVPHIVLVRPSFLSLIPSRPRRLHLVLAPPVPTPPLPSYRARRHGGARVYLLFLFRVSRCISAHRRMPPTHALYASKPVKRYQKSALPCGEGRLGLMAFSCSEGRPYRCAPRSVRTPARPLRRWSE